MCIVECIVDTGTSVGSALCAARVLALLSGITYYRDHFHLLKFPVLIRSLILFAIV